MLGLNDEKDLVLMAIISAVFVATTLSPNIGFLFGIMALSYAIVLHRGPGNVIEFARTDNIGAKAVFYGFAVIGIFIAVAAIVLGSQEVAIKSITTFASAFLVNFTIDNAIIKLVIFGFFIPIVETLFFFGVIFPFILKKARATSQLNDMNTLVAIAMTSGIATSFHFLVRLLNDQSLLTDLLFFGVSGVIVIKQKELSGAALGHVGVNSAFMAKVLGLVRF